MNAVRTYIFQLLLAEVHRIRDTHVKLHGCFCRDYRHLRAASEFNTLSASIHAVARTTQVHTADAYIFQLVLTRVDRIRDTYLKLHGCFGQ